MRDALHLLAFWAATLGAADQDPLLVDLPRFPPHALAVKHGRQADVFALEMDRRWQAAPAQSWAEDYWGCARDQAWRFKEVWTCLADATDRFWPLHYRRQRLGELRSYLGEEWYQRGWMPPAIPWWALPLEVNR